MDTSLPVPVSSSVSVVENEGLLFSILDFCDDATRFNCMFLSSKQHKLLTSDDSFKWRAECLHREKGIYHPLVLPDKSSSTGSDIYSDNSNSTSSTWKEIYLCNIKRKNLWQKKKTASEGGEGVGCGDDIDSSDKNKISNDNDDDTQFHLQVSARFRPKNENDTGNINPAHQKKITLPLYQRLALIQMNGGLECKKEAFKVLTQQGGWFGQEMKERLNNEDQVDEKRDDVAAGQGEDTNNDFNVNDNTDDNTKDEKKEESVEVPTLRGGVHSIDTRNNSAILVDPTKGLRRFEFDNVVDEYSSQESVYKGTAMRLIGEFINGFNVSCIVYGQTGSGKTHTMFGNNDFKLDPEKTIPSSWGIVPRSCHEIFKAIEYRKKNLNLEIDVDVAVSYIEIFGDSVTDLLRQGKSCGQSKVAAQRYVLDGSSEVVTKSMSNTLELLNVGEKQKRKAATAMNERSSRAHSIFIITMKQSCKETGVSLTSRLFLADLGGSEQLKKSQPFQSGTPNQEQADYDRKQRAREAVNINLGLLSLKQCVEALRKKSSFVPYSSSKLTMMLSGGLGGDSKTAVIVCGAQEERHGRETIAAMKFGQTCRGISNTAKTNTNMLQELLQSMNDRIAECEENIKKHERWESKEVKRESDDGQVEIRKVTVVTGAEKYREQLSTLIRQKLELTGDTAESLYNDSTAVEGFGNAHVYGLGNKVKKDCTIS